MSAEGLERFEDHVRRGLARKAVGTLHVMEVPDESELLQNGARSRSALRGRRAFAAAKRCQCFRHARIYARQLMAARYIDRPILRQQIGQPLARGAGENVAEEI